MSKTKRYGTARPALKTGDIVLFSGKGGVSASVKWVTLSRWSHVGMLVAEAYQHLRLVRAGRKGKPSNEYVPADFSEARENMPWLRGALGPEIMLKN